MVGVGAVTTRIPDPPGWCLAEGLVMQCGQDLCLPDPGHSIQEIAIPWQRVGLCLFVVVF